MNIWHLSLLTIQHVLQLLPVNPEPLFHPLRVQTLPSCILLPQHGASSPFLLFLMLFFFPVMLGLAWLRLCCWAGFYASFQVRLLGCYGGQDGGTLLGSAGGHSRTEPSSVFVCVWGCVHVCDQGDRQGEKKGERGEETPPLCFFFKSPTPFTYFSTQIWLFFSPFKLFEARRICCYGLALHRFLRVTSLVQHRPCLPYLKSSRQTKIIYNFNWGSLRSEQILCNPHFNFHRLHG